MGIVVLEFPHFLSDLSGLGGCTAAGTQWHMQNAETQGIVVVFTGAVWHKIL